MENYLKYLERKAKFMISIWSAMNCVTFMRPFSTSAKSKIGQAHTVWSENNIIISRFIDLYGDISPRLAEEDKKIFDLWMENWIEQRQNDFFFSFGNLDSLKTKAISNPVCPFT